MFEFYYNLKKITPLIPNIKLTELIRALSAINHEVHNSLKIMNFIFINLTLKTKIDTAVEVFQNFLTYWIPILSVYDHSV